MNDLPAPVQLKYEPPIFVAIRICLDRRCKADLLRKSSFNKHDDRCVTRLFRIPRRIGEPSRERVTTERNRVEPRVRHIRAEVDNMIMKDVEVFGEELVIIVEEGGPLCAYTCKCTITRVPGTFTLHVYGNGYGCRWVDLVYGRIDGAFEQVTPWRNAWDDDGDSRIKFAHHMAPNVRSEVGRFCSCTAL